MKLSSFAGCFGALCLGLAVTQAQEINQTNPSVRLEQQLEQMRQSFERQQREMRESFEKMIRAQQEQIEALRKQMASIAGNAPPAVAPTNQVAGASPGPASAAGSAAAGGAPAPASAAEVKSLKEQVDGLSAVLKRPSVNAFNPGIGFVVDSIFSYDTKSQQATGSDRPGGFDADLRTAEVSLEASVDPFARAYGVIAASADARTGEANLGVEEASVVTTSLPYNLTVQGGRFFADFGRLSYVHDHDLPFVYRPLVLDRYIGGESRTEGLQVNYLFPTDHYISLTLGVGDSFGADLNPVEVDGYRSVGELNGWGHLSTYFDLSQNLNLETGLSGLVDGKADGIGDDPSQRDRYIGGADITLRYQPLQSTVYRGWTWGSEVLFNSAKYETAPGSSDRENSWGLYSYFEYKLNRQFKVGFLYDWMQDPADKDAQTSRYSPYISWNPSEFQLLRLQFSHTEPNSAAGFEPSDAIYLEWSAIIGRHVHGFKQR
jgi:hypothetical protein